MKFINYTNDGRVVVQHAALILSKLCLLYTSPSPRDTR